MAALTGTTLNSLINYYCKTVDGTFTQANKLVLVNLVKDEIAGRITDKDESYFILPYTFNLVASTIDAREYSLQDDMMSNLVSVELAFDGTQSPLQYVRAIKTTLQTAIDVTGGLTEGNITNNYNNTIPYYFVYRRSIYILSATISAVTNGGRIRYRVFPADLANLTGTVNLNVDPTTTSFGMPQQFHELWARRVAILWKSQRPNPIKLSPFELDYENDLKFKLDELKRDDLSEEILGLLPNTSREGNFGRNL